MKYLYRILRLFFTPKCKHKWKIVSQKEHLINTYNRYTGLPVNKDAYSSIHYVFHKECIFCGDPVVTQYRMDA